MNTGLPAVSGAGAMGAVEPVQKLHELPDYGDIVTPEQIAALNRFMDQFDLTGYVEDK